jgi:oligopeptide transport system ATP-binding protein
MSVSPNGRERAVPSAAGAVPLVEARELVKHFPVISGRFFARQTGAVRAVDGVSLAIPRGQTVGVVGESGCGKSTVGRLLLSLIEPTSGDVRFEGEAITGAGSAAMHRARRDMQIVFQDPYASLNPRRTAGEIVSRPLLIHREASRREAEDRAGELMALVGLEPAMQRRYPHEFSGGQRQRIGIARALALRPQFIVLDEPTSSLDVSVQAQILNLLNDLKRDLSLTYLFISHNLNVVRYFSDNIAVMYLGQVVDYGPAAAIYQPPYHPYTESLLAAVPVPDPTVKTEHIRLEGTVPSPLNPPSGCRFHTRCPWAMELCRTVPPPLREQAPGHRVACHLYTADPKPASATAIGKGGAGNTAD